MKILRFASVLIGSCLLVGCAGKPAVSTPDAVSSASQVFYQSSSLTGDELLEAIRQADGSCTIATVNADGSPNLIVSVAGVADDDHLVFGWADNATKANLLRDKQAIIAYYIYDKDGAEKNNRHRGARLVCQLEEDEAVLQKLEESSGASQGTFLRIVETLPIG
ncbi:MAG: pyridoxamine 5'-phosphate oxidase family protein [Lachnospiraceae bacterium]|nr:pyridoxamine 5'-phosphate oxidase family protein [Lachnospiraceae bacterium]